ncbi:hypothetical protein C5F48_09275 [Cereibacter changlensis JA139]|uniref:DUF2125 domain-containing protein n=2 Tax=Cereibacter changlensis TaxID=402884 RepID=A0A2T4JVV2_9RHOB|nr:DUF2125 domain-containing protein [Cereibacter changlensis]PTE22052.1 hypothetical protein C5F48_09275 [Cereibacter changlensis JA139]PZX52188.1 uncharacterized protein DUF2125 [Cereibacter changlensis]
MQIRTLAGSTALAALAFGSAGWADVTPEEVWQNWQDMSASYGQSMTASAQRTEGDRLTVEGLKVVFKQEGSEVEATIDEVRFNGNDDGTVDVTMSDSYPVTMVIDDIPAEGEVAGEPTRIGITVRQPGLKMTAGGGGEETSYVFSIPTLEIGVDEVDGVDAAAMELKADITLTDTQGSYLVKGLETKTLTSDFSAATAEMVLRMKDEESSGVMNMRASLTDLKGTSGGTLVPGVDMADMAAALKAGFSSKADFTYGPTTMEFDFTDGADSAKGSASTASGRFNVAMDDRTLAYGGAANSVNMTMSGTQIPFPQLTVNYAEAAFDLLMPIAKAEAPQDFRLLTKLVDLKISEEIWAMFDPTKQLPRDPATLVIDASGKAQLDVDVLDPAAQAAMETAPPGEIHALDVNALRLSAAGAELTGTGGFTFDNSDKTTFPGMPLPTGKMELKLVGGNGLLDKLVAMGLIPQDQAMGARMMLGMFARTVEGQEDTLTSDLEFKDKGFYANGQRLQ